MDKKAKSLLACRPSALFGKIRSWYSHYVRIEGSERERKRALEARLVKVGKGVGFGLVAFLFSGAQLPFSSYPLGLALLGSAGEFAPYIYTGNIISTLFSDDYPTATFLSYSLVFLLRFLSVFFFGNKNVKMFCEKLPSKLVASLSGAVMLGVFRCISGGFLFYDLFGLLMLVSATAFLTILYSCAFEGKYKQSALRDAGVLSLVASGVFALKEITFLGFSLPLVLAFIATLYTARECGMLKAGIVGLICGLAYCISYAPMFAAVGLVAGFFGRVGPMCATFTALAVSIAYGVYLDGVPSLLSLAPDLLCASIVYAPLSKLGFLPEIKLFQTSCIPKKQTEDSYLAERKNKLQTQRISEMSEAFSSLADVCRRLSDAVKKPHPEDICSMCKSVISRNCTDCAKSDSCRDADGRCALDMSDGISRAICRKGRAETDMLPEYMRRKCFKLDKVVDSLNDEYSQILERKISENKTEIFAADYEQMSKLLSDALTSSEEESERDGILSDKAKKAASYIGFTPYSLGVFGKRRRSVIATGVDIASCNVGASDMRGLFSKICGIPFAEPCYTVDGDCVTMTMHEKNRFRTSFYKAEEKKQGENVSGDSTVCFNAGDGYSYMLISDGMGSGTGAALTSRLCGVFLEKMLRAGNRKDTVLEMLNCLVRSKNPECFATVDLLEIDLISGKSCFVKSGAAPSYVVRSGGIFKLESQSAPIGTTREITGEQIDFQLCKNDVVVMTSDGIAQSFEDGLWLTEILSEITQGTAFDTQELCARILETAKEKNVRSDDMSVAICRVESVS